MTYLPILKIQSLGWVYDLDSYAGRALLLDDLINNGFFQISGNEKFADIFNRNLNANDLKEFVMNIYLWERVKFGNRLTYLVH